MTDFPSPFFEGPWATTADLVTTSSAAQAVDDAADAVLVHANAAAASAAAAEASAAAAIAATPAVAAVTSGTINGATIGATTPSTGVFTTVRSTGQASFGSTGFSSDTYRTFGASVSGTRSGTGGTSARIGGNLAGALSGAIAGQLLVVAVDSDSVNAPSGIMYSYMGGGPTSGAIGGRTTLGVDCAVNANVDAGSMEYYSGMGINGYARASAGGTHAAPKGNIFAMNPRSFGFKAYSSYPGSGMNYNSFITAEFGTQVEDDVGSKWVVGVQIVQENDHVTRGWEQDNALQIANQPGTVGSWHRGISFGAKNGCWPFDVDSQLITWTNTGIAGRATAVADGVMLRGITFGRFAYASDGFAVDGAGNVGAVVASGHTLQTRASVVAKVATLATASVVDPGCFASASTPAFTVDAPPSGTAATITPSSYVVVRVADILTSGTGHTAGTTLIASGGTGAAATFKVVRVNGGAVTDLKVITPGSYTVRPGTPVTLTGGTGTSITVDLLYGVGSVSTTPGSGYSEFLTPDVASAGSFNRKPVLKLNMTAAQTLMNLNPGNLVTVGSSTPASASATGTAGTITWDANYVYVAVAADTWKRAALVTW